MGPFPGRRQPLEGMRPMNEHHDTAAAAEAARRFARQLRGRVPPKRVEAQLGGAAGMAQLCAIEAVFAEAWPAGTAKELVWLTSRPEAQPDRLLLRAYGAENELLTELTLELAGAHG